ERQLRSDIVRQRESEVLNIRTWEVRVECIHQACSVREGDDCRGRGGQEQRLNGRETWIRQKLLDAEVRVVRRDDVICSVAAAGRITDGRIDHKSATSSDVLHLISAAQCCCLARVPGESNRGTKIIHV